VSAAQPSACTADDAPYMDIAPATDRTSYRQAHPPRSPSL
jgi:hypothetical protein